MKNINLPKNLFRFLVIPLACIGALFVFVYFGMKFSWFNVKGSVSERNSYFNIDSNNSRNTENDNLDVICQINLLYQYAPTTSANIYQALLSGEKISHIYKMLSLASMQFQDDKMYSYKQQKCIEEKNTITDLPESAYLWANTDEWKLMKQVFMRDQMIINKAAKDVGISPRLILSGVIGEQFRFFNNRREAFKQYFEPLKILASLSNTSFGIAGLKPKTVAEIESNLKDESSVFYLGQEMENIVDYDLSETDIESARLSRITDSKDPYYSYLYVGLFMKQIITQWQRAGYDIIERPDVLATLYNLGFYYSSPKANPFSGGAVISISGKDYTFGDLGYEFYYSGELSEIFPISIE